MSKPFKKNRLEKDTHYVIYTSMNISDQSKTQIRLYLQVEIF